MELGQGLSDSISCDSSVPKATTIAMITTSPARIISRSPAVGSQLVKSLRSNPQRRGQRVTGPFRHKRMTGPEPDGPALSLRPNDQCPVETKEMATEENKAFQNIGQTGSHT